MSRCPHCKSPMLSSPWCPCCCRLWEVRTLCDPAPEPIERSYSRPRKSKGMGSRKLSEAQLEAIRQRLATGKYGVQSELAREHYVGNATISRIAAELRQG